MLKVIRIGRYYFIEHVGGRVFWFKYESGTDAFACMATLKLAWASDPLEEGKDLLVNFVQATNDCMLSVEGGNPRKGSTGSKPRMAIISLGLQHFIV